MSINHRSSLFFTLNLNEQDARRNLFEFDSAQCGKRAPHVKCFISYLLFVVTKHTVNGSIYNIFFRKYFPISQTALLIITKCESFFLVAIEDRMFKMLFLCCHIQHRHLPHQRRKIYEKKLLFVTFLLNLEIKPADCSKALCH